MTECSNDYSCYQCTTRKVGCHAMCKRYAKYTQLLQKEKRASWVEAGLHIKAARTPRRVPIIDRRS